jgi:hypothetical protein
MKNQTIIIIVALAMGAILLFSSFKSEDKTPKKTTKKTQEILDELWAEGRADEAQEIIDAQIKLDKAQKELDEANAVLNDSAATRVTVETTAARENYNLEKEKKQDIKDELEEYKQSLLDNIAAGGCNVEIAYRYDRYDTPKTMVLFNAEEHEYAKKAAKDIKNDIGHASNGSVNESLYTKLAAQKPEVIWLVNYFWKVNLDNSWGKSDLIDSLLWQTWTKTDAKAPIEILNKLENTFGIVGGNVSLGVRTFGVGHIKIKN